MIALEIHLLNLRILSRIREIFIESLNNNFTEFFNVRKFPAILHRSLLVSKLILESSNFMYGPLPFVNQLKCTLVKKQPFNFKSAMPKSTYFTYLISISRYFVNISISYRN